MTYLHLESQQSSRRGCLGFRGRPVLPSDFHTKGDFFFKDDTGCEVCAFFFFLKKGLFIICKYCSCLQTLQKRASDLIMNGCELPCGCWDLNSGPLEEQSVFFPAKPSHQPVIFNLTLKQTNTTPLQCDLYILVGCEVLILCACWLSICVFI